MIWDSCGLPLNRELTVTTDTSSECSRMIPAKQIACAACSCCRYSRTAREPCGWAANTVSIDLIHRLRPSFIIRLLLTRYLTCPMQFDISTKMPVECCGYPPVVVFADSIPIRGKPLGSGTTPRSEERRVG